MIPELPGLPPLPPVLPAAPVPPAVPAIPKAAEPPPLPSVSKATLESYHAFEQLAGGRSALVAKLALVDVDKTTGYVVGLLADPQHDSTPLAVICRLAKISLRQLMDLYRDASLVTAHVGAIQHVAAGLPKVAQDVMTRAITHWVTCQPCNGLGQVTPEPTKDLPNPGPQPCKSCNGRGQVAVEPEHDVQKTALTLGGMLRKDGGGVNVSVVQQSQQVSLGGGASVDQVIEKMDQILFGTARERLRVVRHTELEAAAQAGDVVDGETLDSVATAPVEAPSTGGQQP